MQITSARPTTAPATTGLVAPLLASDTVTKNYTYTPSNRGADAQNIGVASSHGGATLALSGTGLGPEFQASASTVNFATQLIGDTPAQMSLDVANATPDFDLGQLTDLTLLSATITGPDADDFELLGFLPGMVLGSGDLLSLFVEFNPTGSTGLKNATLTFETDQAAAFGATGLSFDISLAGMATAVPEPSSWALASLAVLVGGLYLRRRRR